ncbi:MAG: PKD domain-containing protein, partial [Gammaproteobacteria bacterium]
MITKIRLSLVLVFTLLCVSWESRAQSDIALATKAAKLKELAEKLKDRDVDDRLQALEFAKNLGIPLRNELAEGKVLELQRFSESGPIFYLTHNAWAADTVSTLQVWPEGGIGFNLDGSGMTIGEWDAGGIFPHLDFGSRVLQMDSPSSINGHSTHVAGTLIGTGLYLYDALGIDPPIPGVEVAMARGMAYNANLNAWDWNSDTAEMAIAASTGLLASNHSYGIAAGWLYYPILPPYTWWWIGGADPADVEDPKFGYYDADAQLWDQISYDAPYYLIVKAAGNDRSDTGPEPGEEYIIMDTVPDADGNPQPLLDEFGNPVTSTLPRNPDCAPNGYDCLPTISVAKNILTIGAVNDIPGGYTSSSQVVMTPFSGWGPTDDGRVKPDLVGNGEFLISNWLDNDYSILAGTSMASPNVAGSLLLLQEHYRDIHGGNFMRSATLKGLAIHTADDAGNIGPDYAYGWGLLNTKSGAQFITEHGDSNPNYQIIENALANGAVDNINITVTDANSLITATLVWTDPPGTPVAPSLDPPDLMLINDLDLLVTKPVPAPATFEPWVLNPTDPAAAATTGNNFRDNVEQVKAVVDVGTYTVKISHKGTLYNSVNQNYSLIVSVTPAPLPPLDGALLIDEDFTGGMPAGWSVQSTSANTWTIGSGSTNNTGGLGEYALFDMSSYTATVTSLLTPSLDFSTATAAELSFQTYYAFDLWETINVDVSTNGGSSWSNVWQYCCNLLFGQSITLPLTDYVGSPNAKVRFRFDNGGENLGYTWQIDSVRVEVVDDGGTATTTSPTAGFTLTTNELTANFTDISSDPSNTILGWLWNLGDGNIDTVQNPTHAYAASGSYMASQTLIYDDGSPGNIIAGRTTNPVNQLVSVSGPNVAPSAGFSHTTSDLTATYTDASTDSDGIIVAWDWDFGDGNGSTLRNPSHSYSVAGTYTVTLVANDNDGATDLTSQSVTVTEPLNAAPNAGFTHTTSNLTATFTDTSSDSDGTVVAWDWNFGDGSVSAILNPSHSYTTAGTYTV